MTKTVKEFRAWDTQEYQFIDGFAIGQDGSPVITQMGSSIITNDHVIVEQFTGLWDAGGNKIFEGDILRAKRADGNNPIFDMTIKMRHGVFGYDSMGGDFIALGLNHHYFDLTKGSHKSRELRIIGNIHQNREDVE